MEQATRLSCKECPQGPRPSGSPVIAHFLRGHRVKRPLPAFWPHPTGLTLPCTPHSPQPRPLALGAHWPRLPPRPQVVSLGLYFGEQAYLRSSWNVLDGFLVFVSIIDIVVSLASAGGAKILGVLRVLRLLRTLRPLR